MICVSAMKTTVQRIGRNTPVEKAVNSSAKSVAFLPSSEEGLDDVFECPARDDGIVAEDQEGGGDAVIADDAPFRAGSHHLEGSGGVLARVAADEKLGYHDRYAQEQDARDIDQQEGGATIFAQHIRETPDVSQSDGASDRGQDNADFTTECCSFRMCHFYS